MGSHSSECVSLVRAMRVLSFGLLVERGLLSAGGEAQLQFQMRLRLARYGIVPPGNITLRRKMFANPSEEIFANRGYRPILEEQVRQFGFGSPTGIDLPYEYIGTVPSKALKQRLAASGAIAKGGIPDEANGLTVRWGEDRRQGRPCRVRH